MSIAPGPPSLGSGPPGAPLPGWLAPVVQLTTQVGIPTVFALVLLWFVLTRLDKALSVIETQEEARTTVVEQMGNNFIAGLEKQASRFELAIQQNIAVNRELAERYHGPQARTREPR
jgi:hypothetical protein